jgi:hypothetical protein
VLILVLERRPTDAALGGLRDALVGFCVAAGMVHRIGNMFSLFDRCVCGGGGGLRRGCRIYSGRPKAAANTQ